MERGLVLFFSLNQTTEKEVHVGRRRGAEEDMGEGITKAKNFEKVCMKTY